MRAELQNYNFRRLLASNALWWQALWIEQILCGWLALELTNSPWMVALWGFFRMSPFLLGIFTPVITDRFPRKELLLVLQGIVISGFLCLAVLYWQGALKYWQLVALSVLNGIAFTLDWPTRRSLIPDLVGRENAIDGILLENVTAGLGLFLGPIIGGVLLQKMDAAIVLVTMSLFLVGSSGFLMTLKTTSRTPGDPADSMNMRKRLVEGLRYIRGKPRILNILIVTIFINAWVFTFFPLLSVFAREILGINVQDLGVLAGSYGLGTLVGLYFVHLARTRWPDYSVFIGSCLLTCLAVLGFSGSTFYGLSLMLLFLAGIGQSGFSTLQSGIILRDVNEAMRGRAMATLVLAIGAGPLGGLQSTAMVAWIGAPAAVAVLSTSALAAVVFLRHDREGNE